MGGNRVGSNFLHSMSSGVVKEGKWVEFMNPVGEKRGFKF